MGALRFLLRHKGDEAFDIRLEGNEATVVEQVAVEIFFTIGDLNVFGGEQLTLRREIRKNQ